MINPNELRIGNYVAVDNYCYKIETITKNGSLLSDLNTNLNEGICEHKLIEPIELTEEWLIKAGFKKHKESDNFYLFSIGENPITNDFILLMKYFKDDNKFFFNNGFHVIKYVHNIQNLYFALTGSELTFNL